MSTKKQELRESAGVERKYTMERKTWDRPIEFLLNVMGFNIGLGNIWRFPYLCYKNGGGAFLIPYLLVAAFCGFPLLFFEISMGQFTRKSGLGAWDIVPVMKGIAWSGLILAWYFMSYIMIVMAWVLFYFFHCFTTGPLPWSTCDNQWNTNSCSISPQPFNGSIVNISLSSSTKEFWTEYVLHRTEGIHDLGSFSNWKMILCFLSSWFLCYICVLKGTRTTGKVAYFTVIGPYVMLVILLVRGATLEGAVDGILYYITPRLEKLAEPQVWLDAGGQILYSLAVCVLTLFAFGSHNKFQAECYKYAFISVGACCGTSIFVGFIIFSYIGHMALQQGKNISEVAESGPGLVFEVLPAGISYLPVPQVWAAMFFLTLMLLAIDTAFGSIEGCTSFLEDLRPSWFVHHGQQVCRLGMCAFSFLLGIPMLLDGGIYIFEMVNMYGTSGICLLLTAFFEAVGVAWIYGVDRFFDNVKEMIGYRPNVFFKYCYLYFAPAMTLCMVVAVCSQYSPLKMGEYEYPGWADVIGWILLLSVLAAVPIIAAKTLLERQGSLKQRWHYATKSRIKVRVSTPEAPDEEEGERILHDTL